MTRVLAVWRLWVRGRRGGGRDGGETRGGVREGYNLRGKGRGWTHAAKFVVFLVVAGFLDHVAPDHYCVAVVVV